MQTQDLFDAFQVVQGRAQGRGSDPVEAVPPDRDPDQVYYDEVMDAMDTYLTPELQDSWDQEFLEVSHAVRSTAQSVIMEKVLISSAAKINAEDTFLCWTLPYTARFWSRPIQLHVAISCCSDPIGKAPTRGMWS